MNRQRAFTLIELLVYLAIFAIVAGILTTIFFVIVNSQKKQAVSGEVNQQLNFVLGTVQRLVGDSALVEVVYEGSNPSSTCTTFCTLKLRRTSPAQDPTLISSDANGIYLQEGSSSQVTLTTNKVLINHFRLTKHEIPGGHAVVEVSTSFAYNTANPSFAVTKAIESAVARVNAATFDADLLPNQDNTFDIGQIAGSNLRWKNGRFSGDLTVGGQITISGGSPGANKVLTSDASGIGSWQVATGVPAGAVMFFNLSSCPSGWTELTSARGRYIVGLNASGTLAGTAGTSLTDLEDRPVGQHTHTITVTNGSGVMHNNVSTNQRLNPSSNPGSYYMSDITASASNAGSVAGTNAPYIQLLVCQKS